MPAFDHLDVITEGTDTIDSIALAVQDMLRAVAISCYTTGPIVHINGRALSVRDIVDELPGRYRSYVRRSEINPITGIREGEIIIDLTPIDLQTWYELWLIKP